VQGDTSSAFAAGLAAFYAGVPVAHVEAGLRTGDLRQPWPEEMHRRLLAQLAALHFAPTERAFANLISEGVDPAHIEITGNTAIDALRIACDELARRPELSARGEALVARLPAGRAIILATVHRRENHGAAELSGIAKAFAAIAARGDCELMLLAHPNPGVARLVEHLAGRQNVHIVPPLDYFSFVALLRRAALLMTDSGGIQEEAACLGKPVLVLRASTERAEILAGGNGLIVGAGADRIVAEAFRLLDDPHALALMSKAHDSFGDGYAAERIARRMLANLPARQTIA
jgi:UDP-N-acetylglucosamine 2-epimerase